MAYKWYKNDHLHHVEVEKLFKNLASKSGVFRIGIYLVSNCVALMLFANRYAHFKSFEGRVTRTH
jgi:hypothetical protein